MQKTLDVILLAGGRGSRMKSATPKQFLPLGDKSLLAHSLVCFQSLLFVANIIVVCDPLYHHKLEHDLFAPPGERRQDSVYNGLQKTSAPWICVHDGARPFISETLIVKLFTSAQECGAATLCMPLKWTVKEKTGDSHVKRTVNRDHFVEIQTPQILRRSLLVEGFEKLGEKTVTDDVSIAEFLGHPVKLVDGCASNIKITTPEDYRFAQWHLAHTN